MATALQADLKTLQKQYDDYKAAALALNMARGKPASEQLDMVQEFYFKATENHNLVSEEGTDCRNYGAPKGLAELRRLFAGILEVDPEAVVAQGNSSLEIMYHIVGDAMTHKTPGADRPWSEVSDRKFLCPAPGYDRHFAVTEHFSFELIAVPMLADGPDMDRVEALCAADDSIKGIWCVPKYSNPDGITYSAEVCRRLASMKAAPDFKIMWDNAYGVHHLYDDPAEQADLSNILALCREAGNEDRVFMLTSLSKVTFAGGGIGAMATSKANLDWYMSNAKFRSIGPDKVTQLEQVRLIEAAGGLPALMRRHAAIIRPKFEATLEILEHELGGTGLADWLEPKGGYFISVNLQPGRAKKVVQMCKEAGVTLTGAGATYPCGNDPADRNIRIAPTFPSLEELKQAMQIFCVCVKLAAAEG